MVAGRSGIHITDNHHQVGPAFHKHLFIGDHDIAGLFGMGAAADTQVDIRAGQAQVVEKRARHVGIVMLPGMDDNRLHPGFFFQRMVKRGDFHEIGSGGTDEMDKHSVCIRY